MSDAQSQADWAALLKEKFDKFLHVVPEGRAVDYTARIGDVYEKPDGSVWLQVWPTNFKDINFPLSGASVDEQGVWLIDKGGVRTLLRTAPEQRL